MSWNATNLSEKIQSLNAEQIVEVEDFVDFLRLRADDRGLTRTSATVSASAFEKVWANPEDDAYDAL